MKTVRLLIISLFSILSLGQVENGGPLVVSELQEDDVYLAAETIKINAIVQGDLVAAGGTIIVNDSIYGDLIAASGDMSINKYIGDDVRISGGTIIIDAEIGDDLMVFGGEVFITKNAKINGNLFCYAGEIEVNGEVIGTMKATGTDILVNGTIQGTSKIIGENVAIGTDAKFLSNVEFWSRDEDIDFKESLVNTEAQFNANLKSDDPGFSWFSFGKATAILWVFYVLSAFLIILILHLLFKRFFSRSVEILDKNMMQSFGYGIVYILGVPLIIVVTFLMIIGIPLGLFLSGVFIFSLLFGHLIAALLLAYYVSQTRELKQGFWNISFLALLFAIGIRLLTIIPFVGIIISIVVLSMSYGILAQRVLKDRDLPDLIK